MRLGRAAKKIDTLRAAKQEKTNNVRTYLMIVLAAIALAGIGIIKFMRR